MYYMDAAGVGLPGRLVRVEDIGTIQNCVELVGNTAVSMRTAILTA